MRDWKIPVPKVETVEDFLQNLVIGHESLSQWSKEEKIRTCSVYVCYCSVNGVLEEN